MRHLALLLALASCASASSGPGDDASSGGCSAAGCACVDDCDPGLVCASQICVPSEEPGRTTGGAADASSTSGTTGEEETGGSEATSGTTGEDTEASWGSTDVSSSSSSTGPSEPFCGDGAVDEGEDCDDGNADAGDGCDAACAWEPWQHVGVAHDVPVADLHGWTQCWADDYSGKAKLPVSSLAESCTGSQLLMACGEVGSGVLVIAAHAPREDVLFPVDYSAGERHAANGVAWYWSPTSEHVGFGPAGNTAPCIAADEDDQMCIRTSGAGLGAYFTFGRRCGAKLGFTIADETLWQRVFYQAG